MCFVWFYAALSVACRSGQGFNAWSFANKPCVAICHYGMRAVAVGLLPLRHVHLVYWVHQVHLAKCFVTTLATQLLMGHFSEFYLFRLLTFDSVLSIFVVDTLFYLREETT